MRIEELIGPELDEAVALALGMRNAMFAGDAPFPTGPSVDEFLGDNFEPSERWDHGGPIIERERIMVACMTRVGWVAEVGVQDYFDFHDFDVGRASFAPKYTGPTPLIAAMRAFVASKTAPPVKE